MALGDVADYLIGLVVERVWPQASLLTFLALYFVSLWIAWLLAVKLTEPKASKVIFVIFLAEKRVPLCCGALQARTPVLCAGESDCPWCGRARPHLCKAERNILPRWNSRQTCVRFALLGSPRGQRAEHGA